MPFDRAAAKAAGYSDQEIDEYLNAAGEKGQAVQAVPTAPAIPDTSFDRNAAKASGYTDEEINNYLSGRPVARAQDALGATGQFDEQARGMDQPGFWSQLGDATTNILARGVQGVSPLFDMGTEAMGLALSSPIRMIPGAEKYADALSHPVTIGGLVERIRPHEPDSNRAGQYAGAIAEALGGVFTGGIAGNALKSASGPVARRVGEVLTDSMSKQVAGAVTGSTAAETVKDMGGGPVAQMIAGVSAGALPFAAGGAGGYVGRKLGDMFTSSGAEKRAGATLLDNVLNRDEALSRIDAMPESTASGAQPTLAEVTLDPGLAGTQRSMISHNKVGAQINDRVLSNNAQRVSAASDAIGPGDPGAVQSLAQAQDLAAQQAASRAIENVGPAANPETSGIAAREALESGYGGAKAATSAAYQDPRLTQTNIVSSSDEFMKQIEATINQYYGEMGGSPPPEIRSILNDISGANTSEAVQRALDHNLPLFGPNERAFVIDTPQGQFISTDINKARRSMLANASKSGTFDDLYDQIMGYQGGPADFGSIKITPKSVDDAFGANAPVQLPEDSGRIGVSNVGLQNLDRRLADFAGSARVAGRNAEASFAEKVRQQINDFADSALPPEQREALTAAKAARKEQGDVYEKGPVGAVLNKGRYDSAGQYSMPAGKVPEVLIPKGRTGVEAVQQLERAVGKDKALVMAREEMRRQVEAAKGLSGIQRLKRDFDPVLRQYPEIANDVAEAEGKTALAEAFRKTPFGKLADPGVDVEKQVAGLLRSGDNAKQFGMLVKAVSGNDAAKAGLRRAVGTFLERSSTNSGVAVPGLERSVSSGNTLKAMEMIMDADAKSGLFDDKQRQVLKAIMTEVQGARAAETANRVPGSNTARDARTLTNIAGVLFARIRSIRGADLAIDAFNNQKRVDQLLAKAILEPKFAAELMRKVPQGEEEAFRNSLRAAAFGGARGGMSPGERKEDTDEQE